MAQAAEQAFERVLSLPWASPSRTSQPPRWPDGAAAVYAFDDLGVPEGEATYVWNIVRSAARQLVATSQTRTECHPYIPFPARWGLAVTSLDLCVSAAADRHEAQWCAYTFIRLAQELGLADPPSPVYGARRCSLILTGLAAIGVFPHAVPSLDAIASTARSIDAYDPWTTQLTRPRAVFRDHMEAHIRRAIKLTQADTVTLVMEALPVPIPMSRTAVPPGRPFSILLELVDFIRTWTLRRGSPQVSHGCMGLLLSIALDAGVSFDLWRSQTADDGNIPRALDRAIRWMGGLLGFPDYEDDGFCERLINPPGYWRRISPSVTVLPPYPINWPVRLVPSPRRRSRSRSCTTVPPQSSRSSSPTAQESEPGDGGHPA